jgi:hypothetical protein
MSCFTKALRSSLFDGNVLLSRLLLLLTLLDELWIYLYALLRYLRSETLYDLLYRRYDRWEYVLFPLYAPLPLVNIAISKILFITLSSSFRMRRTSSGLRLPLVLIVPLTNLYSARRELRSYYTLLSTL